MKIEEDLHHLLGKLNEESGEVVQMLGKVQVFGFLDVYKEETNKERLEEEIGQWLGVLDVMVLNGHLDRVNINRARGEKLGKMRKWYQYAKRAFLNEEEVPGREKTKCGYCGGSGYDPEEPVLVCPACKKGDRHG